MTDFHSHSITRLWQESQRHRSTIYCTSKVFFFFPFFYKSGWLLLTTISYQMFQFWNWFEFVFSLLKDAFKAEVERDSAERSKRRQENLKTSTDHKDKGNSFFKAGNFTDAVEWYTKAIVLSPDQYKYYSNRAQVCFKWFLPRYYANKALV